MINFLAPYLSPRATMVPLSWLMVTKKISTPQLNTHISVPFFIRHKRMVPSFEPETTISLSGDIEEHQTYKKYIYKKFNLVKLPAKNKKFTDILKPFLNTFEYNDLNAFSRSL